MAIRFAAVSGLVLAAALTVAAPARAQGFFSFYEMSPRQIVGMLSDDGYELRGPMLRRGDVYVADVTSVSGRPTRLIVSARDGRIIERFASEPRWRHYDEDADTTRVARAPHDFGDNDRAPDDHARHNDVALGDMFNPPNRVYGNDSLFAPKPTPPAVVPDDGFAPKPPKHHVAKKHKDTSVAKATPDTAAPSADAPKPAEGSPVAAVAPANPAPEPKKPDVQSVRPAAEAAPKPVATPEPVQTKAETEKRATAEPAPAPAPVRRVDAPPRKKLNDLPVGTLD